ncbi:retrovirus-related pol polyprotein from transposon TNT 1-94, partial [Tanacetum coccineum]
MPSSSSSSHSYRRTYHIKKDTAYLHLNFTRNHEDIKTNTPYTEDPIRRIEDQRIFHSTRKLFKTSSLDYSSSPEFDLFSNHEDQSEEEVAEAIGEPTMEEYMTKTRENYGSRIARPKIDDKAHFELKDLFHIPEVTQDQIMLRVFTMSLTRAASRWLRNEPSGSIITWEILKKKFLSKYYPPARTAKNMKELNNFQQEPDETLYQAWERFKELLLRQILDSKGTIPSMKAVDAKKAIQEMADHSQKWHNRMSTRTRSTDPSDGLTVIQAQLNNLGREIKKVLQERGSGSLPSSTETNLRDHVKSILTTVEAETPLVHHIERVRYAEALKSLLGRRKPLEFQVGDKVMLKVSPWKGVIRFIHQEDTAYPCLHFTRCHEGFKSNTP